MHVELSMEQIEFLSGLLENQGRTLRIEISRAKRREFRDLLHHQQFLLEGVVESLNAAKCSVLQECP